jgi:vesicle-associated membrane protein 7
MAAIEFAAILRGHTVIASIGELTNITERDVLRLLPSPTPRTEQKMAAGKLITFLATPGLTFVCVSPQPGERQRALAFLDAVARRWSPAYFTVSASASHHALDHVFASNFSDLFADYARVDKAAAIARELDQTQEILADSMSKALGRSSELESIAAKSDGLLSASEEFRTQASNLKWKMRWQWIKSWLWWILALALIVWFFAARLCDGWRLTGCL